MSTICFDIKRVDENYVCIQHCNTNYFEYEYHLPLSFWNKTDGRKKHWWLTDKKYRYVWLLVGKDQNGIERIFYACNDKVWTNKAKREYEAGRYFGDYADIRFIKLPFERITGYGCFSDGTKFPRYETNDMQDQFKLWCPVDLNEKHHTYAAGYKEVEPIEDEWGFKMRRFEWIPPEYLKKDK